VGVVAFDSNASVTMAVTQAGPLGFGLGRADATSAISNHLTNLAGSTSIGDGVELAHDTLVATTGYDHRAVVVFTDGDENTAKFISDIESKIDDRVYAIGLGTVNELKPVGLSKLVKNTGGCLMLTGPLSSSEQFRLAKYYLQILSGVTNSQIVVDPDGYIGPNEVIRVPFDLTEADYSTDVILLSPYRKILDFQVETPLGEVIDPSVVGGLVDSAFVAGVSLDAYRLSLPVISTSSSAHAGRWYARLEVGQAQPGMAPGDYVRGSDNQQGHVLAHGVPFSVTVQAQSSLTMTADASPRRATPATTIDHRVTLAQLDIPLDTGGTVVVEATDPMGSTATISLVETGTGIFTGTTDAPTAGVYTFRYVGRGQSFAGVAFMREQVRTVGVWVGGDDQPPGVGSGSDGCCAEVISCLLEDRGVQRLLKRYEINAKALQHCLADHAAG